MPTAEIWVVVKDVQINRLRSRCSFGVEAGTEPEKKNLECTNCQKKKLFD